MSTFNEYQRLRIMFRHQDGIDGLRAHRRYPDVHLKHIEATDHRTWLRWQIELTLWEKKYPELAA